MFDWFRARRAPAGPPFVDRVWVSLAARDRALVRAALEGPVTVIAFFGATRDRAQAALAAAGSGVQVTLADRPGRRLEGAIVVVEHHPLPGVNLALLERLASEAPGVVPVFYSALDEPLMLRFGGQNVAQMMARMGLVDDEPIEHPMVGKALTSAREKVAARLGAVAAAATSARSMEEWLELYLPA